MVERHHLPRQFPGPATCDRRDHRTKSKALGLSRDRGERDRSIHKRNIGMPIKQKMIPDEEAVPTWVLGIERECEQIVRIAVLAEIWHVDSALHFGATPS